MDIEHPAIREIERTGYPNREYTDWEQETERIDYSSDENG